MHLVWSSAGITFSSTSLLVWPCTRLLPVKGFNALGQAPGFYRTSRDNKTFHVNNNKGNQIQTHLLGDSFPPMHSKKLQLIYCIAYITYTVCFSSLHLYSRHLLLFKPDLNSNLESSLTVVLTLPPPPPVSHSTATRTWWMLGTWPSCSAPPSFPRQRRSTRWRVRHMWTRSSRRSSWTMTTSSQTRRSCRGLFMRSAWLETSTGETRHAHFYLMIFIQIIWLLPRLIEMGHQLKIIS